MSEIFESLEYFKLRLRSFGVQLVWLVDGRQLAAYLILPQLLHTLRRQCDYRFIGVVLPARE